MTTLQISLFLTTPAGAGNFPGVGIEQVDTSAPIGKMVFTVLAAVG
jgi:hypothetical protein